MGAGGSPVAVLPGQVEGLEGGSVVAAVPLMQALAEVQACKHTTADSAITAELGDSATKKTTGCCLKCYCSCSRLGMTGNSCTLANCMLCWLVALTRSSVSPESD